MWTFPKWFTVQTRNPLTPETLEAAISVFARHVSLQ